MRTRRLQVKQALHTLADQGEESLRQVEPAALGRLPGQLAEDFAISADEPVEILDGHALAGEILQLLQLESQAVHRGPSRLRNLARLGDLVRPQSPPAQSHGLAVQVHGAREVVPVLLDRAQVADELDIAGRSFQQVAVNRLSFVQSPEGAGPWAAGRSCQSLPVPPA